jgi:hypothetical protein
MNEKKDEMIFVMMCLLLKEKKINRKKTHKEERRDLSLSLLASFFTTRLSLSFF